MLAAIKPDNTSLIPRSCRREDAPEAEGGHPHTFLDSPSPSAPPTCWCRSLVAVFSLRGFVQAGDRRLALLWWPSALGLLPVPPGPCGLNAWPLQRREIIPKPRPCVSPVAFEALIPLLRIPTCGPGARGVGQWEPKQNKGAKEGRRMGTGRKPGVYPRRGRCGHLSQMTPGPLVDNSGGFRCMYSLRGQSVEPGVVDDRAPG